MLCSPQSARFRTLLAVLPLAAGAAPAAAQHQWDPPQGRALPELARLLQDPARTAELVAVGRRLFVTPFGPAYGVGRPAAGGDAKPTRRLGARAGFDRQTGPDASACVGCHHRSGPGGSGDYAASVFVASATRYAVATPDHGDAQTLRRPPSLLGAGLLELLARELTRDLLSQRDAVLAAARASGGPVTRPLASKGIAFGSLTGRPDGSYDASGVEGVDGDLVARPFGWRGQAASLREFSISALNQHHGVQALERFGWERTGRVDFDEDGVAVEFTPAEVTALVLFVASLPPPAPRSPASDHEAAALARGRQAFARAGCAECHPPRLPLTDAVFSEPGPFNPPGTLRPEDLRATVRLPLASPRRSRSAAGTAWVAAFTDLKRHRICDETDPFFCNEVSTGDGHDRGEFVTADLWGLGQGPPYGHHGGCASVSEAIVHHAGEAAKARQAFLALGDETKRELVAFLLSLGAPAEGRQRPSARTVAARGGR